MNENINISVGQTGIGSGGLRRFTVRMVTSNRAMLLTNELPHIMHALRHSRYADGDVQYRLGFVEPEEWFDPDNFHTTLTLMCRYGMDDITPLLMDEDIIWLRYTEDGGGQRTGSDAMWNQLHTYSYWREGRKKLILTHADLDAEIEMPKVVRFTAIVTVRDGRGDGNTLAVEYKMN